MMCMGLLQLIFGFCYEYENVLLI